MNANTVSFCVFFTHNCNKNEMSKSSWGSSWRNGRSFVNDGHAYTKKPEAKKGNEKCKYLGWHFHKCKMTAIRFGHDLTSSRNVHSHEVFLGQYGAQNQVQKMKQDTKIQQVAVNISVIAT